MAQLSNKEGFEKLQAAMIEAQQFYLHRSQLLLEALLKLKESNFGALGGNTTDDMLTASDLLDGNYPWGKEPDRSMWMEAHGYLYDWEEITRNRDDCNTHSTEEVKQTILKTALLELSRKHPRKNIITEAIQALDSIPWNWTYDLLMETEFPSEVLFNGFDWDDDCRINWAGLHEILIEEECELDCAKELSDSTLQD